MRIILLAVLLLSGCANYYKNLVDKPVVVSRIVTDSKDIVARCLSKEVLKYFGALTIVTTDVNNFGDWSEVVVRARVGVFIIFTVTKNGGGSLIEVRSGYDAERAAKAINDCST